MCQNKSYNIIGLERLNEVSLGEARNQAVACANGDYVCTWDDDDWHHSSRLTHQLNMIRTAGKNYEASILNRLILYDQTTNKAYLSFYYDWEGTLLCKRDILLDNPYTIKDQGEDSSIVDFLKNKQVLYNISETPFLYIYIYHRGNTWNYFHFKSFFNHSELLNENLTQHLRQLLE